MLILENAKHTQGCKIKCSHLVCQPPTWSLLFSPEANTGNEFRSFEDLSLCIYTHIHTQHTHSAHVILQFVSTLLRAHIGYFSMSVPISASAAAAAAKSLQSCPTLCNPIDGSPPGSPIPEILQARTLEWVSISYLPHYFLNNCLIIIICIISNSAVVITFTYISWFTSWSISRITSLK